MSSWRGAQARQQQVGGESRGRGGRREGGEWTRVVGALVGLTHLVDIDGVVLHDRVLDAFAERLDLPDILLVLLYLLAVPRRRTTKTYDTRVQSKARGPLYFLTARWMTGFAARVRCCSAVSKTSL